MNKQIKELFKQAANKEFPELIGDIHPNELERFAELLIKECIAKCEVIANIATITNTGEMARKTKATADSCARMIKEHFGVEE